MEQKYGFDKMTIAEFDRYINSLHLGRTVLKIQQHHTYIPSYQHFSGANHFERQKAMQQSHIQNGWSDIGQHFTIFPDGIILSGRSLENAPACIYNQNQHSICIENLGFFDEGFDVMRSEQSDAIIAVTAILCRRFSIPISTDGIVYHHWFDLGTGERNNGSKNNKSCPGTAFFGGNKPIDCERNFLPLVKSYFSNSNQDSFEEPKYYAVVITSNLNIRTRPTSTATKATDRNPLEIGSVLRVYQEKNRWLKISNSQNHWVYSRHTQKVEKAIVNADILNVRSGPSANFPKTAQLKKGEQVFISRTENNWSKISLEDKWVKSSYLTL